MLSFIQMCIGHQWQKVTNSDVTKISTTECAIWFAAWKRRWDVEDWVGCSGILEMFVRSQRSCRREREPWWSLKRNILSLWWMFIWYRTINCRLNQNWGVCCKNKDEPRWFFKVHSALLGSTWLKRQHVLLTKQLHVAYGSCRRTKFIAERYVFTSTVAKAPGTHSVSKSYWRPYSRKTRAFCVPRRLDLQTR